MVLAVALGLVAVLAARGGSGDQPRQTTAPRVTPALPVYARPISDASGARADTPELLRKHAYYSEARTIATPFGPGYVVPAPDGWTCLVVPARPDGYGEGCATEEQIAERGLPVANTGYRDAGGVMAAVLPSTATDATLHLADGSTRPLTITDGVVTAAATGHAKVTFRIGDRTFDIKLYADIRCVQGGGPGSNLTPEDVRRAAAQMGVPVCDP